MPKGFETPRPKRSASVISGDSLFDNTPTKISQAEPRATQLSRPPVLQAEPGVLWEFEDKVVERKIYRVASHTSNDTCSATQIYWSFLQDEACQLSAISQKRNWSVKAAQRNFSIINYCATDEEIQELLNGCSTDDHGVRRRFGVGRWIGAVLAARTGIPAHSLERYSRFKATRRKQQGVRRSR